MSENRLGRALAAGLGVDLASAVLLRGIALATTVLVARVLAPGDYGAVSLALAIYGVSDTLTNPSLGTAVIRQKELDDHTIDVAWTLSLLRAALLGLALFCAAPLLASLWKAGHETASYLRILSLAPLTGALGNLHAVRLQRALRFGRAMMLDNTRLLAAGITSLVLLVVTRRADALVIGTVAGNVVYVALSWGFIAPRPRLAFSRGKARELSHVSRWLVAHSILVYLSVTVDNLYVGRTLGLAALGAYALAWRIVNTFMTLFTRAIAKMLIPTYQTLGGDLAQLRRTVMAALFPSAAVGALASAIVVMGAHDIFFLVSGGGFPGAAPVAVALIPYVYTRIINNVLAPLYQGVGSPRTLAMLSGLNLCLLLPAMWVGNQLGAATGIAAGVSAVSVVVSAVLIGLVRSRFQLPLSLQLKATLLPVALVTPGALAARFATGGVTFVPLRLGLGSIIVAIGFVMAWEVWRRRMPDIPSLVEPLLHAVRQRMKRRAHAG